MDAAINVTISGSTVEAVQKAALKIAGGSALSSFSNEELLTELRQRMAAQTPALVVRVLPFGEETAAEAPKPERKTRERKTTETAKVETTLTEGGTILNADTPREEPKAVVPETQQAGEQEVIPAGVLTMDDVKAALNACSAKIGQAATREIMIAKSGGAARLVDVKPESYAAVVAALNDVQPVAQAA